jgi:aspartate/methionine/tyrosine aminotransferase
MSPSPCPLLVNSVISSLPSSSAAAANHHLLTVTSSNSSASMGWTLRRSFASSIVALLSARASSSSSQSQQTASSRIMTSPTSTATAADVAATTLFVTSRDGGSRRSLITTSNKNAISDGGAWSNIGGSRVRKTSRSFCHLKQLRSNIISLSTVLPRSGPLLAESTTTGSSSSSSPIMSSPLRPTVSTESRSKVSQQQPSASSSSSRLYFSTSSRYSSGGDGTKIIGSKLSSARAQAAIQLLPSYLVDARAITKYSPIASPEGALQLSVAENQLCELPITGLIGIVENGGEGEEGGRGGADSSSAASNRQEMTLADVLSQLASSKCPRPSDLGDGAGDATTSSTGNVFQRDMIYYQPTQGVPSLRRAMANYLQSLLLTTNTESSSSTSTSRQFNSDNIILGAGCNAVLENLCMCLANPGDAALIPTPYYASFEFDLSARAGCHIVPVNTFHHHPDGRTVPSSCSNEPIASEYYYPNISSLDEAYHRALLETGRPPRILLLSHPNNPLGICYPPNVVQECINWCREKEVHLISDEIYAGSVYRKVRTTGEEKGQPTFVSAMALGSSSVSNDASHNNDGLGLGPYIHLVYALSKDFALSGLRVGVTYTENEEILLPLQKLNDMCQISSQTQLLVERMMCADAITEGGDARDGTDNSQKFFDVYMKVNNDHIRARCDKLHSFLSDVGIPSLPADSGLFVWMDLREFLPPLVNGVTEATEPIESKEVRERQLYLTLMKKYGLLFTPGMSMRSERAGFFRFVFTAASEEEFELGLARLRTAVEEMRSR